MAWTSRHFPFLLMKYIWSLEQKWTRVPASIVSTLTPQKDPNCDICLKTKITRASCRRRAGTVVPKEEHFGDLTTAEGSESHNNHRYAVVVQDLATQQLGCVLQDSMHWFLKVESLGETRCKKSWNQFKEYDSQSVRYVKRVSRKRKDHLWENKCQSPSSSKSLRYEI